MSSGVSRDDVLRLMDQKEEIERSIKNCWDILKNNNIGRDESLTDSEGYPRSDIDVYQVRHARHDLKCLENDHREIFKRIGEGLTVVHLEAGEAKNDPDGINIPPPIQSFNPFAKIMNVEFGSPADIDGLQIDDKICKFGSVTSENYSTLSDIGGVVQHSKNRPIQVIVRRSSREFVLSLTPRQWSGRGLLGCNIIPLDYPER